MKKVLISILAVAAMFAAVSCAQSVEDKGKDFCEKAINATSAEEFLEVSQEMETWYESLSKEDQEKVQAATKHYEKQMEKQIDKYFPY